MLTPDEMSSPGEAGQGVVAPGGYDIMVGPSSATHQSARLFVARH